MISKIDRYLRDVTPDRHPVLSAMEEYATEHNFPIVGPLVGRFLYQLTLATKARKILELGSGYGYSAFWFSLAGKGKAHITMTDSKSKNKRLAFSYFKEAGLQSHFDFKVGNALSVLKKLDGTFDIVFNDVDKIDYPRTIDPVARRLRKGGLFITDNLIWDGKVAEKNQDETTRAIVEFTRNLYQDSRFFTTIMPVRDGLAVALRL
jgi:predicted O-methyltransferase YrrM